MSPVLRVHSTSFLLAAALLAAFSAILPDGPLGSALVLPIIGLILVLGLPHGAMDLWISRRAGLWDGALSFVTFHAVYLALAGATVLAFLAAPALALAVFLLMSIWHFADDWTGLPKPVRFGAASSIVLGPTLSSPEAVTSIFATVTGLDVQPPGAIPYPFLLVSLWLVGGCIGLVLVKDRRAGLELLAVAGLSVLLPPLAFFTAYFTLLHSPRHLLRYRQLVLGGRSRIVLGAYTAAAVGIVLALAFLLPQESAPRANDAAVRAVFTGLAALTLPHMILLEFEQHREAWPRLRAKLPGSGPSAGG